MKKIVETILVAFIIFILGSLAGSVIETIVGVFQNGYIEIRQGVLYGPFVPVYGVGAVVFYYGLSQWKSKKAVFFMGMLLGGITEFVYSFVQESWFGGVSWDYSNLLFNIQGRTSLLHCIYWGIFALVFYQWLIPFFHQFMEKIQRPKIKYVTAVILVLMLCNIGISTMAGIRNYERKKHIQATNIIEEFLDDTYPQTVVDKIYAEKIKKE